MSGSFAIGAVSMVLRRMLSLHVGGQDVGGLGAVQFSALPLDRIPTGATEPAQLNLFLYQVTHNAAWRNVDLPARDSKGERTGNPPMALNLHYLLTAFGPDDFVAESLLGYGMQVFHEVPFLSRETIRNTWDAKDPTKPVQVAVAETQLANQIEQLRICPHNLNAEEMSKLWTTFQSKFRPSVAYEVSVVLIDMNTPTRTPLPVLKRGKNDRGALAQPDLIPPFPTLEALVLPRNQPAALVGDVCAVDGHHFAGDADKPGDVTVGVQLNRLRGTNPSVTDIAVPVGNRSAKSVRWVAPDVPAGVYSVAIRVMPNGKPAETRVSNETPLLIAPRITGGLGMTFPLSNVVGGLGDATVNLTCSPAVLPDQNVSLALGSHQFAANAHTTPTDALSFSVTGLAADTYRVRLRVDGVDSLLIDRSDLNAPQFDETQTITLA